MIEILSLIVMFLAGYILKSTANTYDLKREYKQGIRDAHMTALDSGYRIRVEELRSDQYLATITVRNDEA